MKFRYKQLIRFTLISFMLPLSIMMASCGSQDQVEEGTKDFHEMGMKFFKEGFYDLLPQGKTDEAMAKFALAEKAFKRAVAENPQSADTRRYLARSYSMQRKHNSAAAEYIKAIEIEPNNLDNYLYLASVYVRLKRYDDALKTLNHAKTLSKESGFIELMDDLIKKIRDRSNQQKEKDELTENI